jgi:hypothetical protein
VIDEDAEHSDGSKPFYIRTILHEATEGSCPTRRPQGSIEPPPGMP